MQETESSLCPHVQHLQEGFICCYSNCFVCFYLISCISQNAVLWPQVEDVNVFILAPTSGAAGEKQNQNRSSEISQLIERKRETCFIQTATCLVAALHSGPFPAPAGVEPALCVLL